MRGSKYVLLVLAAALLLPSVAAAQGTLTGTVRDASGAVLPGVTVEANSPAIQGAVRTVVTDNAGIRGWPSLRERATSRDARSFNKTPPAFTILRPHGLPCL